MEFYHKLQSIINSDKNIYNYVTTTSNHSSYQGIYHLDLSLIKNDHNDANQAHHVIKLQLLLMDYKISQCSIWEVVLDDTAILKHVRYIITLLYNHHLIYHDIYQSKHIFNNSLDIDG